MRRRTYDRDHHAQLVTFSCYRRRKHLDDDRCKQIVLSILRVELNTRRGVCSGFVVMPNHVHAIVWLPGEGQATPFLQEWKQRTSVLLRQRFETHSPRYAVTIADDEPIWNARFYAFNLNSATMARRKLEYMHANPVRAGLVAQACDWRYSSARFYELGRSVGVPMRWVFD